MLDKPYNLKYLSLSHSNIQFTDDIIKAFPLNLTMVYGYGKSTNYNSHIGTKHSKKKIDAIRSVYRGKM